MVPAPKPGVAALDTLTWATANDPVVASMLASVGAGPRWNGLAVWAWAPGIPAVTELTAATANVDANAMRRNR